MLTDDDNDWGDLTLADPKNEAVDAYYAAAKAWDYFADVYGRSGIAGDGRGVALYTSMYRLHNTDVLIGEGKGAKLAPVGCHWSGAGPADQTGSDLAGCIYVDGKQAAVQATIGPAATLDVIGGTYASGVVRHSAGLTGTAEGTGLAFATAHIFGTMVEFYAGQLLVQQTAGLSPEYRAGPADYFFYLLAVGSR